MKDEALYKNYPEPQEIIDKICSGIGGELLQLSIWTPLELEKTATLNRFNEGLYDIGMALHGIDDLSDLEEDLKAEKVNLGISYLIHDLLLDKEDIRSDFQLSEKNATEKYQKLLCK